MRCLLHLAPWSVCYNEVFTSENYVYAVREKTLSQQKTQAEAIMPGRHTTNAYSQTEHLSRLNNVR